MYNKYRNSPCSCGSGEKLKNCCFKKFSDEIWQQQATPTEVDYYKRQVKYNTKKYKELTNGTPVKKDS